MQWRPETVHQTQSKWQHEFHTLQFNFNVLSTKNTSAGKRLLIAVSVHTCTIIDALQIPFVKNLKQAQRRANQSIS